jgi:serine/threonine-protein kinase
MTIQLPAPFSAALADRYVLQRELGAGGMATVYLAEDVRHRRRVALKVLHPELSAVLGPERFLKEIELTASLQHPHILPLFDSGSAEGQLFYVMPFIDGETLRTRLEREQQLPLADVLRIAREVADALQYAHDRGVIHRDIKPENILLQGGHALVADFGIALAVQSAGGTRMTQTGLSLGTPHYMSPEQAMGEKTVDARSDVYALGAVTYEMLTGEPPYDGPTSQAVVAKMLATVPVPPRATRPSLPEHVEGAVLAALEKLPADRMATARGFAEALGGGSGAFTRATVRGAATAPSATRGVPRAVAVALGAVTLASLAVGAWGWRRGAGATAGGDVARYNIGFPAPGLSDIVHFRHALSPDGRTIVFVGPRAEGGIQLHARALDQLVARPIAGTTDGVAPAVSPDGRQVAFFDRRRRAIVVVGIEGGAPSVLVDSLVDGTGVSWGDDGWIYYDGHLPGDGIARVRGTGGAPEPATAPDTSAANSAHVNPFALPGGRGLLYTRIGGVGSANWTIGVRDARTGEERALTNGVVAQYLAGHLLVVQYDGTLAAAPFDLGALAVTGPFRTVVDGVSMRGPFYGALATSPAGVLSYITGEAPRAPRELAWVDRSGRVVPVDSALHEIVRVVRLSRDGRRAYLGVDNGKGSLGESLLKELDGGPVTRLPTTTFSAVAWSPDGRTLVYGGTAGFTFVGADGRRDVPAPLALGRAATTSVDWSRDGRWLAFQSEGEIWALRADSGGTLRNLTETRYRESGPAISPDGRWIAHTAEESPRREVVVRSFPDGAALVRQVSTAGGFAPRWAPDGSALYYIRRDVPEQPLVMLPILPGPGFAIGVERVLFPTAPFRLLESAASYEPHPDGRRFLFSRPVAGVVDSARVELVLVQRADLALARLFGGTK